MAVTVHLIFYFFYIFDMPLILMAKFEFSLLCIKLKLYNFALYIFFYIYILSFTKLELPLYQPFNAQFCTLHFLLYLHFMFYKTRATFVPTV